MKPRQASRGRLTRSAEFERVYRQGRSTANRYLVLYSFPNPDAARSRVGLSVSRRVGGAVQRNRVKRMLREAVTALADQLADHCDFVVVARPEIVELAEADGLGGVHTSLAELLARTRPRSQETRRAA
jgi:ribonuclease P protein component